MNSRFKIRQYRFKNRVLAASGTFGYGKELTALFDVNRLGGFVTKTITLQPQEGNPPPRIYDVGYGIINSIGLQNPGLETFLSQNRAFLNSLSTNVLVSVYGNTSQEWTKLVSALDNESIAGIELNFSCPNIKGIPFSSYPGRVHQIVSQIRSLTHKLVVAKLSFSPTLLESVYAAQKGGADAVCLINTLPALAICHSSGKPVLGNITGGLSGPCIKPVALRCVYEVVAGAAIPVIGCGGIMDATDALDFFRCGASLVQIGSANLIDPDATIKIIAGIKLSLSHLEKIEKQK